MTVPERFIIALLPDDVTTRRARRVNALCRALGESEHDLTRALPHLSVLHIMLDPHRLDEVERVVRSVVSSPLSVGDIEGYLDPSLTEVAGGYVVWEATGTPSLSDFCSRIVKAVAPLRAADVKISWPMNTRQQAMHARYGFPNVVEACRPHITIAVGAPNVLPEALCPWPGRKADFRWEPSQLVIGRAAQHYGALMGIDRVLVEFSK